MEQFIVKTVEDLQEQYKYLSKQIEVGSLQKNMRSLY
jgi:hypothetical protein